jgi:hypothetical protein
MISIVTDIEPLMAVVVADLGGVVESGAKAVRK